MTIPRAAPNPRRGIRPSEQHEICYQTHTRGQSNGGRSLKDDQKVRYGHALAFIRYLHNAGWLT